MAGEFADLVCEFLAPMGDVRARRMFGGWGVYLDGVMFALISDDTLYFRTDERTLPAYEAEGLPQFAPFPDKPMRMPYYRAPDSTLDDGEEMLAWARPAFEAALRARATAKPKRKKKAPSPA
ncbi:TfoX/Sxy family protein [Azospirillum sp.]|uniref:TfoX/Sxy family protein n=1 Tax=Azospirillum sp. TaxID=34012 RepID=UPI002D372B1B|nr:TfoX/Sxy family protein [Azospirillum sp.]HYD69544.1 TfoX/Sxy family protein [Azospirillum sp.]